MKLRVKVLKKFELHYIIFFVTIKNINEKKNNNNNNINIIVKTIENDIYEYYGFI